MKEVLAFECCEENEDIPETTKLGSWELEDELSDTENDDLDGKQLSKCEADDNSAPDDTPDDTIGDLVVNSVAEWDEANGALEDQLDEYLDETEDLDEGNEESANETIVVALIENVGDSVVE